MDTVTETVANFTSNAGYREFQDGVFCMKECIVSSAFAEEDDAALPSWYDPGEELHTSQNAFVFLDDETLLFDTWSPASRDSILETLDDVLAGRDLDYLVVSHLESNHAGNYELILDEYPDATLVAPEHGAKHERELYRLDSWGAEYVTGGDTLDLGTHTIEFVNPIFYDQAKTTFMYERTTDMLFTVDWFGFQHMGSECTKFVDEMKYDLTYDQLDRFNGYALVWLRFVDPGKADEIVRYLREDVNPAIIAPAHGQIIREDIPKYLDLMGDVVRDIAEDATDYHIHSHQMSRFGDA